MEEPIRTQAWLVRHGATQWSQTGHHTSVTELPLLPSGEEDARRVGERIGHLHFPLVLSSPRLRARETARLAGFTDPEIVEDLAEWAYGPAEGLTSAQIQERVPGWRIWTHGAPAFGPDPGGESVDDVEARLTRVVERVRSSGVERVLIFGHGHSLRAMAMVWLGLPIARGAHFPLHTGRVSVLGYEKTSPALVAWNSGEF